MRCLTVVVLGCGLVAACSSVGPQDGTGGQLDVPAEGGAGGVGGRWGYAGAPTSAQGVGGHSFGANDLECLRALFAQCPTDVGTCQTPHFGSNGMAGAGVPSSSKACYANGTTITSTSQRLECPSSSPVYSNVVEVSKPDGSLCYSVSYDCDCNGCGDRVTTVRDGSGAIVGQTFPSTTRPGSTAFACTSGQICDIDWSCDPIVPTITCGDGPCP